MMRTVFEIMMRQLVTFFTRNKHSPDHQNPAGKTSFGCPVVNDSGELVGVLSMKDCLEIVFSTSYYRDWGGAVREYMSPDVTTIDADTDLVSAAEFFLYSNFRRFPVLREGRLVGQICRCDLLGSLIKEA